MPHAVLVLTRKSNQSIMIGDDIEVSVLSIMGEKVRIGIQRRGMSRCSGARCTWRSSRNARGVAAGGAADGSPS